METPYADVTGAGRATTPEMPADMSEHTPYIDFENLPAPNDGFLVTQFIAVRSVARSRAFYSGVLDGQVANNGAARGRSSSPRRSIAVPRSAAICGIPTAT